jgi:hypothetical protein
MYTIAIDAPLNAPPDMPTLKNSPPVIGAPKTISDIFKEQ